MRRIAAVLVGLCLSLPALACMNEPYLIDAEPSPNIASLLRSMENGGKGWRQAENIEALRVYDSSAHPPSHEANIRRSALLVYAGKVTEAVDLLVKTEKKYPGHYETASNLGTALELSGDNAGAMKWIKEGIIRNPESHQESEWLHVKILEAKIALERDPRWLDTHSVSGGEVGQRQGPPLKMSKSLVGNMGKRVWDNRLSRDIFYQLRERLKFLPPSDPVVSELLMEFVSIRTRHNQMTMSDQRKLVKILAQVSSSPPSASAVKANWIAANPIPISMVYDHNDRPLKSANVDDFRRHQRQRGGDKLIEPLWSSLVAILFAQFLATCFHVKVVNSRAASSSRAVLSVVSGWTVLGLAIFVLKGVPAIPLGGLFSATGALIAIFISAALLRWSHWAAPLVARPLSATLALAPLGAFLGSVIPGATPLLLTMLTGTYCALVQLLWSFKFYRSGRLPDPGTPRLAGGFD